ncbi:helix-turn-helix transcriptional regulator [Ktedonosporobacter rubrisoli]|nr:helix-turn-helix transcriptional regulator [Ktedonosporobacter rubrisoli]
MSDESRRAELAHFLRIRRKQLSPSQFRLPAGPRKRRTPGLRREELASLAGISPTWYTKLEQGQEIQVSAQVLDSLAQALQLSEDERTYLYVLAREQLPLPVQKYAEHISADLQAMLDALSPHPAFIMNTRWDIVGWNRAAALVFIDFDTLSAWERNFVWIMFTRAEQRDLFLHWEYWARETLALFRASIGRDIGEPWFIGRRDHLMQASPEFCQWWEAHEVSEAHMGHKELMHPQIGLLKLQSTALLVADDPNLKLCVYTPLPQTDTAQKLIRLVQPRQEAYH